MENRTESPLAIKVMRLSRPSLISSHKLGEDLLNSYQEVKPSPFTPSTESLDNSPSLLLPQSFGTIYLGETFHTYIRVQNIGSSLLPSVTLKVDLQTAAQRLQLSKTVSSSSLEPLHSIDEIINHEVTEIGTHILVCDVSYQTNTSSEPITTSRYYKFQVSKPLDVKTKFYNAESDDIYLEVQIQNTTHGQPIYLEKVILEPTKTLSVVALNDTPSKNGDSSASDFKELFGAHVSVLQPDETRQYLYCLRPSNKSQSHLTWREKSVGKLDLVWRTTMGDRGRLQTSPLQRLIPTHGDIRLVMESVRNPVKLFKKTTLLFRILNTSERSVDLTLVLEVPGKQSAMLWVGASNRSLKKIEPNQSTTIPLTVVPMLPGLHTIKGLKLIDTFLKRTYDYMDLTPVFVIP